MNLHTATILAIAVTAISAIFAAIVGVVNGRAIDGIHAMINSELEKWVKSAVAEALGRGRAEGVEQERRRTEDE